jgi:methyl-accepting chemotaxis protein
MKRMKINTIVLVALSLIGLVAMVFAGRDLVTSLQAASAARQAAQYAQIDRQLLKFQQGLLSERADSPNVLKLTGNEFAGARQSIQNNRQTVDEGFDAAKVLLMKQKDPDIIKSRDALLAQMDALKQVRAKLDENFDLPLAQRNPEVGREMLETGQSLLSTSIQMATTMENAMAKADPLLGELAKVKQLAWQVRNVGGSVWEISHIPYSGGALLTSEQKEQLGIIDGRVQAYWGLIDQASRDPLMPPQLRLAYTRAEEGYFGGEFGALRKSVVASIRADQIPTLSFSGWVERLIPAINTVTDVATVSMDLAAAKSIEGANKANLVALESGGILLVIALLLVAAFRVLKKRLFGPLDDMTRTVTTLAQGDMSITVPYCDREDEIGKMANSVLVFQENGKERLRLEAAAKEFQNELDRKLKEMEAAFVLSGREQKAVVETLAANLGRLANGDLTARIEMQFEGQYAQIKSDYNAAIDSLCGAMSTIAGSTQGIRGSSNEIASASDDLSRRTEQQAASLEETAAALDQITATVRRSAEGAKQASDVASGAKADAEKSGAVVREAVMAMTQIEQSSDQITNIIGVIDEIAFQTNLLALNAGVEAARAGDSGRGFAVVAQEVRALAQRSAEAAKQINSLIASSRAHVESGVKLVGHTGHALTSIVGKVAQIDLLISEMASSAQEQATGLHQVNVAVNQMDQVTQQNAAMVEEATAAAANLRSDASELERLVSRFQTNGRPRTTMRPELVHFDQGSSGRNRVAAL